MRPLIPLVRRAASPVLLPLSLVVVCGVVEASDLCPPTAPVGGEYRDICDMVVRIVCEPGSRTLTGFSAAVGGVSGVITALHGILGCESVWAGNQGRTLNELQKAWIDVRRDAAFLVSPNPPGSALRAASQLEPDLRVAGYPQGLTHQQSHRVEPNVRPFPKLLELLPPAELCLLMRRRSPDPEVEVLSLSGPLGNGHSGAPILTMEGAVLAVANGGLERASTGPFPSRRLSGARSPPFALTSTASSSPRRQTPVAPA